MQRFAFSCLLLETVLCKTAPGLSSVGQHESAGACLTKNTWVSDELCPDTTDSATGCERTANESVMYMKHSAFKQKHTWNEVIYASVHKSVVTTGSQDTNAVWPRGAMAQDALRKCPWWLYRTKQAQIMRTSYIFISSLSTNSINSCPCLLNVLSVALHQTCDTL